MNPVDAYFDDLRNAGVLPDADLHVEVENPVCGDVLHLWVRLRDDRASVADARFQVWGCPAAIAAGSLLAELVVGRTREELDAITDEFVDERLGGLPAEKAHAAVLARDAVSRTVALWTEALAKGS